MWLIFSGSNSPGRPAIGRGRGRARPTAQVYVPKARRVVENSDVVSPQAVTTASGENKQFENAAVLCASVSNPGQSAVNQQPPLEQLATFGVSSNHGDVMEETAVEMDCANPAVHGRSGNSETVHSQCERGDDQSNVLPSKLEPATSELKVVSTTDAVVGDGEHLIDEEIGAETPGGLSLEKEIVNVEPTHNSAVLKDHCQESNNLSNQNVHTRITDKNNANEYEPSSDPVDSMNVELAEDQREVEVVETMKDMKGVVESMAAIAPLEDDLGEISSVSQSMIVNESVISPEPTEEGEEGEDESSVCEIRDTEIAEIMDAVAEPSGLKSSTDSSTEVSEISPPVITMDEDESQKPTKSKKKEKKKKETKSAKLKKEKSAKEEKSSKSTDQKSTTELKPVIRNSKLGAGDAEEVDDSWDTIFDDTGECLDETHMKEVI